MATLTETLSNSPVELWSQHNEDELQLVIRSAYKQVLGNVHIMESQCLDNAESMLRNSDITVREFVRMIAQSELYQSLFFHSNSPYRFIELNCKHLLGRAPLDQEEISEHVKIYNEQGYIAEINSYIDSEEYNSTFGENIVPFPRSLKTQKGIKNIVFNRTVSLLGGFASSDNGKKAQLVSTIATNLPQKIKVTSSGIAKAYNNTSKKFYIVVSQSGSNPLVKQNNTTYTVSYSQLSQQIQNIHKIGGKIVSIVEK
ncbi:phycobilisome rod-core linker polypeptide [Geminocystis sp. NIES-3709]|uniref:phycobilisome rod-core linker polypeptide n=1 Tax=Geminocystis sp. NIES-3709 TaxID=1617448 RepID=UPI0005FC68C7|nr:phycobilisome rod-core linker polypeptide [Geminocystis sp. NIES-3709]BAQ65918.1 phycobilisome phycoerythrin-associated linker polypeptide [Geminocystis sp. NIES-3709]